MTYRLLEKFMGRNSKQNTHLFHRSLLKTAQKLPQHVIEDRMRGWIQDLPEYSPQKVPGTT